MSQAELLYFAFGANMASRVVRTRRRVNPARAEAARLPGYRLVFEDRGIPLLEPAFASIREDAGAEVWGVLYHLNADEFACLDRFEGPNYRLIEVAVEGRDTGKHSAFAYVTCRPVSGRRPSRRYLRLLREGAVEHELPGSYLDELDSHRAAWAPPGASIALSLLVNSVEWVRSYSPASQEARRGRRRGFPGQDE
ncbi:MAG: gamma-glutamylcyclotransferase [Myxococcales bacterium]|nr:gamma-glutamylcyclotransferase [Myxococcales bacterium]